MVSSIRSMFCRKNMYFIITSADPRYTYVRIVIEVIQWVSTYFKATGSDLDFHLPSYATMVRPDPRYLIFSKSSSSRIWSPLAKISVTNLSNWKISVSAISVFRLLVMPKLVSLSPRDTLENAEAVESISQRG